MNCLSHISCTVKTYKTKPGKTRNTWRHNRGNGGCYNNAQGKAESTWRHELIYLGQLWMSLLAVMGSVGSNHLQTARGLLEIWGFMQTKLRIPKFLGQGFLTLDLEMHPYFLQYSQSFTLYIVHAYNSLTVFFVRMYIYTLIQCLREENTFF